MIQCPVCQYNEKIVGLKVLIKGEKIGTLQYLGETHFAGGLWCGIELDEEVGENDGIVNGVRYFNCKKKFGIFIPASDVNVQSFDDVGIDMSISDAMSESRIDTNDINSGSQNCDFHVSSDSQLVSFQNLHQESKLCGTHKKKHRKLPVIKEEKDFVFPESVNFSGFGNVEEVSESDNIFSIEKDLITSAQSFNQASRALQQIEENYVSDDSDDSLGILPHVLEGLSSCDGLLDEEEMVNLSTAAALHYTGEQLEESYMSPLSLPNIIFTKSHESPVCIDTNLPKYASTPKHETDYSYVIEDFVPSKHKFSSGSHFKNENTESALNKTREIDVKSEYMLPIITDKQIPAADEHSNPEKKNLNVTFSNLNPENPIQILLNKTFDKFNILSEEISNLPLVTSPVKSNKNVIHEEFHTTTSFDLQDKDENIFSENENALNVTCDILKPSDTNTTLSENLELKNSKNVKRIPINILNTTVSYPQEDQEKILVEGKEKILNTTYELIEELVELERKIEVLQPFKNVDENINFQTVTKHKSKKLIPSSKGDTITTLSENVELKNSKNVKSIPINNSNTTVSYPQDEQNISVEEKEKMLNVTYGIIEEIEVLQPFKNVDENINYQTVTKHTSKKVIPSLKGDSHFLTGESKINFPEFDTKENTRKSVGSFGQISTSNAEGKYKINRQNSAYGNMYWSSKPDDSSETCYDKELMQRLIDNFCIENPIQYYPDSGSSTESMHTYLSLKSECAGIKIEEKLVSKITFQDSDVLNKTINLDQVIPEVGKTVVKKPRSSMHFYEHESSLDTCEASLLKTQAGVFAFDRESKNSSAVVEKRVTQLLSSHSSVLSSKKDPKATASTAMGERKLQHIRKAENVFPQKYSLTQYPSFKTDNANLLKSNIAIPAVMPSANKDLPSEPFNPRPNLSDVNVKPDQQSKSEQMYKVVPKPSFISRIPSALPAARKGSGVKSSRIPRKAESASYDTKIQHDR